MVISRSLFGLRLNGVTLEMKHHVGLGHDLDINMPASMHTPSIDYLPMMVSL